MDNSRAVTASDCQVRYQMRKIHPWQAHLTTATSTGHITHRTTSFLCNPNIGYPEGEVNP